MEAELKCPSCRRFYADPVLLSCSHSVCHTCAAGLVQRSPLRADAGVVDEELGSDSNSIRSSGSCSGRGKLTTSVSSTVLSSLHQLPTHLMSSSADSKRGRRASSGCGSVGGGASAPDFNECGCDCEFSDRSSVISETDSGVVCGSLRSTGAHAQEIGSLCCGCCQNPGLWMVCPQCRSVIILSCTGVESLPRNVALATVVNKYCGTGLPNHMIECQLCEDGARLPAEVYCEQCNIAYCAKCREGCHPLRGPLSRHRLLSLSEVSSSKCSSPVTQKCREHADETLSAFCATCGYALCCLCVHSGRHVGHAVQAVSSLCRTQKVELSKQLQRLSDTARRGSEFLQSLTSMERDIQSNSVEFEALLIAQLDAVMETLQKRRDYLLQQVSDEKRHKEQLFREQISRGNELMQSTTGLLQLSIEMLKEPDPFAFLQVSNGLINRVSSADQNFKQSLTFEPCVSPDFNLKLRSDRVFEAIQSLSLGHLELPRSPHILTEECCSEQNTITVSWQPLSPPSSVDGYVVELSEDDGSEFREVYSGPETLCTIEGLNFNTMYIVRVHGFNDAGDGSYSTPVCLRTAAVARFTLDPQNTHCDVALSNGNMTATCVANCGGTDCRVVLGSVGFSAGVHYWQFVVDRIDGNADPAFGVAHFDVTKDQMLGKDNKAWSMYIDRVRSWYLHAGAHCNRCDGGIGVGSIIGVLLDLKRGTLTFFVNGKPRGNATAAFTGLHGGVFYPAVSVNRSTAVTLRSGIAPPSIGGMLGDDD